MRETEPPSNPSRADDFSSLFEFLPIGAYRSSVDGRQLRANPALVALNGYASEAEMLAATLDIGAEWYVEPGRRDEFRRRLESEGHVIGFESEVYRHLTRERIWVSEHAHAVRDGDGRVLFYEGTVEEITDRVQAREALRDSQQQLRQIVDLVPGMVYRTVVLPDGRRRASFVSGGVRELFGIEPEALLADGNLLQRLRHPDDSERIAAETDGAAYGELDLHTESRVQLADGTVKWVQLISAPGPAEHGHAVRVGVIFDITARKRAEEALRANSELWKRALESSGDGVWDWHPQSDVEIYSPQLAALYGYSEDELVSRPGVLDALTHPDDVAAMRHARDEHLAGLSPAYVNEHRVMCKDGQWKWILSRGIVIQRDDAGQPLRAIGTHTDVTAQRQAEALRQERDRAAAADLAKSQFLSRVSHELRTPLNAILGFAQLLELDPGPTLTPPRQSNWIQQVLTSGRHLLALMDDILDTSSAQTGQLPIRAEPMPLHPVLEEVYSMAAGAAREAGVAIVDDLSPGSVIAVLADRKRLKQILSNLLSNAIKYNRRGGWVRVSARHTDAVVEIEVADSGPGFDAAQLARLFQPFERLGAQSGPVPGTGLGLALSRQLAEAMGGQIEVQSAPEQGARFTLTLPAS